jgi:copper chaperone
MVERELSIEGMSCQHCVMAVRKGLAAVDGVEVREVRIGSARVAYDETKVDPARVEAAVTAAGYRVRH